MNAIHTLWQSLRSLKGNQRACVITEPLWAIPYNLFLPFTSLYMSKIGLTDAQIGMIASLGLAMEFLWGLLSGAIVDKYGRRGTMLAFGLVSWTIPCALWAAARGYWYFAVAIVFNGMWRVTGNSFSCMIVEDGDTGRLVHIYTILNIMGLVAGFLTPLAGLCMDRFTLVPTMRALYALAMALMAVKFLVQYRLSRESGVGVERMRSCKGQSLFALAFGRWPAFLAALRQKRMRLCVLLMVLMTCFNTVQANFWPLFVTARYGISDSTLSVFPLVKALVTLAVYLLIVPRISLLRIRRPLLLGLAAQGLGLMSLLALLPLGGAAAWAAFFSAACDAFALAMLGPLTESMMSLTIPGEERARINSLIFAGILLVSTPVGWIAGQMAERSRVLPLVMNLCLVAAEIAVALGIAGAARRGDHRLTGPNTNSPTSPGG
jgi:MFS family permease